MQQGGINSELLFVMFRGRSGIIAPLTCLLLAQLLALVNAVGVRTPEDVARALTKDLKYHYLTLASDLGRCSSDPCSAVVIYH